MIVDEFELAYEEWMRGHLADATGERLRRLAELERHAEKQFLKQVWWPMYRSFEGLIPEYEVKDFRDGERYLDFAYIRGSYKICIEIDGYGPHWKQASRRQFGDHLMRQLYLTIDGWIVIRFSYDYIVDMPRQCQQALQQLIGKLYGNMVYDGCLTPAEKDVIRVFVRGGAALKTTELNKGLDYHPKHAIRIMRGLVQKGVVQRIVRSKRTVGYRIVGDLRDWSNV